MATFNGNDGVVEIGANNVAEVLSFNVTQSVAPIDDTVMGDTWKTHKTDVPEWSGSISCYWDDTDTNGQVAMTVGASVSLSLGPEGETTGDYALSGTATITSIETSVERGGIVTANFNFTGNGALTIGTHA